VRPSNLVFITRFCGILCNKFESWKILSTQGKVCSHAQNLVTSSLCCPLLEQ
jgi:hypothetical protein